MLNYEEFKNEVKEKIVEYIPEEFRNMEVIFEPVPKLNGSVRDAIIIRDKDHKDKIYPTIYLDGAFADYQMQGDLEIVLQRLAENYSSIMKDRKVEDFHFTREYLEKNVVMQIIGTEANKELLEEVPHREILDCSIIYRVIFFMDDSGLESMKVTNSFAGYVNIDEEELFRLASENTKRLFPVVTCSLTEHMEEVGLLKIPQEMMQEMPKEMKDALENLRKLYYISNKIGINGAANLAFPEIFQEMADKFETDLYILPASIHELLCFPAGSMGQRPKELKETVEQVNRSCVRPEERLTDNVYLYDRKKGELSIIEVPETDAEKSKRGEEIENEKEKNIVA